MAVKTLPGIRPNAGLEIWFEKRLEKMVADMHKSVIYWVRAAWRRNPPKMAQDASMGISPARYLQRVINVLIRRWQKQFDAASVDLAQYFSTAVTERSDKTLQSALRKAGLLVKFKMTVQANDVLQATIAEQVGLIKSIPSQYFGDVQSAVMRSVSAGRDLKTLADELENKYDLTRKRAILIARDQNNKATANIQRARFIELGIKQAIWKHSHAGKKPRPSHVAADGKIYEVEKGMFLDGEWLKPGEAINCRCFSKPILPTFAVT